MATQNWKRINNKYLVAVRITLPSSSTCSYNAPEPWIETLHLGTRQKRNLKPRVSGLLVWISNPEVNDTLSCRERKRTSDKSNPIIIVIIK